MHTLKYGNIEISSGSDAVNSIKSVSLTQSANNGNDLKLGSVCAAMMEVAVLTPNNELVIPAGAEVELYRDGIMVGTFIIDKPNRKTPGITKYTGYDRVTRLDKDLSSWLKALDGWPYTLVDFSAMVAAECGVEIDHTMMVNPDHPIAQFSLEAVTGRQMIGWCAEIAGCFVIASPEGKIFYKRYAVSDVTVAPTGELFYYRNGLTYEDYTVARVDAVQAVIAGAVYGTDGDNVYRLTDNPYFHTIDEYTQTRLNIIRAQIPREYTPLKLSMPYTDELQLGDGFYVKTRNGTLLYSLVMVKTVKGGTMTIECTGSERRDNSETINNPTFSEGINNAMNNQSAEAVFRRLTNNGQVQGLYRENGQIYINVEYLSSKVFTSEMNVFFEPGMEEFETIKRHILKEVLIPDDRLHLYDFNSDGVVSITDMLICRSVVLGLQDLATWDGAQLTKATVTLSAQNPEKAITISGRNMWGRSTEVYFGINGTNVTRALKNFSVAESFSVGGSFNVSTIDGLPALAFGNDDPKKIEWKDNGDGTFSLIGR